MPSISGSLPHAADTPDEEGPLLLLPLAPEEDAAAAAAAEKRGMMDASPVLWQR
jgi:hypothetical protein